MSAEQAEGQAAEQPPKAADKAGNAELLYGSQAAGTADSTEVSAIEAAGPLHPGQPHHPAAAARSRCQHSQPNSCRVVDGVLPTGCEKCSTRLCTDAACHSQHLLPQQEQAAREPAWQG